MANHSASTLPSSRRLNSDFWRFWVGQTISNLGTSVTLFALPLLVYKLTGSALNLAITSVADFLPYLLFGLVIGAWADRMNRKRLMILTDIARALAIATIPLMTSFHLLSIWWVYGVGFTTATLSIFFESAQFAAIPRLVDQNDYVTANGRIQASYSAASVLGPFLAGLLLALLSVASLFIIDSLSFLVSTVSLALIRISFNSNTGGEQKATSLWHDILEGLRYVIGNPVLRNISAMMALVNFVGNSMYIQLVLFAKRQLLASDTQVGWLFSAGSIGIVVLSLAAGVLRKRWSFSKIALGALMVQGLLTIVLSLTHEYWTGLALWTVISGLGILFNINTMSLRQAIVPNQMLGRIISIAGVLAWSAIPVGSFLGGLAIERTKNVALVYGVIGVLVFLIPVLFSFTALGRAERYLP